MTYTIIDHGNENTRTEPARSDAEDKAKDLKMMVDDPTEIEVVQGDYENYEDYQNDSDDSESEDEPVPVPTEAPEDVIDAEPTETAVDDPLDELGESLGTDPLSILPGHMIDQIQGQPAINKRGYAMIAERYGVEVQAHIEQYPWDNDEGRCVARAVAETEDGKTYQDHATACEGDGDMSEQLVELASTRALKRVTGWATGLGIVSYQELSKELE